MPSDKPFLTIFTNCCSGSVFFGNPLQDVAPAAVVLAATRARFGYLEPVHHRSTQLGPPIHPAVTNVVPIPLASSSHEQYVKMPEHWYYRCKHSTTEHEVLHRVAHRWTLGTAFRGSWHGIREAIGSERC